MKVKIHREGQNIIFVLLLILLAINIPAYLFMEVKWIPITLCVISVIMFAAGFTLMMALDVALG